ncbi:mgpp2cl-1, protein phosphatase 2C-like protein 1 [Ceratocystis pirilliformis]|uniref:Mgpp2cl-1, protein phosphatase 2C-like protein 1 n=1 Tax=Ceratocystis pirilliformis TaxID=259994 RepID=A0ABR3YQZ4_9PEZI
MKAFFFNLDNGHNNRHDKNAAGKSEMTKFSTFSVGVCEDSNKRCRRTMEDTHAYLYDFLNTRDRSNDTDQSDATSAQQSVDNGYFAIFDGHAGTFAAEYCGKNLHTILADLILKNPEAPVPEMLDQSFTRVDSELEQLPLKNSGCTAAVAVLRWEDRVPSNNSPTGSQNIVPAAAEATKNAVEESAKQAAAQEKDSENITTPTADSTSTAADATGPAHAAPASASAVSTNDIAATSEAIHNRLKSTARRQQVLYTANVGDARIVLCRGRRALRLSYDHKGSDENESRRITSAGGLILNNRVNGVLAVTRALGDIYMKDLVTGHPYTTETVIQPETDEFIIIACDGLWDVCSDQEAVDLIRNFSDPHEAALTLVDHALNRFSTDNLTCVVVRFKLPDACPF